MIELGDLLAAWPIPELKDGRHQPDARHVIRKSIIGQQIERGGMGRGRPWIRLQGFVDVEYPNRQTTTPEQPPHNKPTGPPPAINTRRSSNPYSENCCLLISAAPAIPTAIRYNSSDIDGSMKRAGGDPPRGSKVAVAQCSSS